MKKLFFAAALAIVAVGGAVSTTVAETLYAENSSSPIECDEIPVATCSELFGPGTTEAYLIPASEGDQGTPVSLENYARP